VGRGMSTRLLVVGSLFVSVLSACTMQPVSQAEAEPGTTSEAIIVPPGDDTGYNGPINPLPRNLMVRANDGGMKIELRVDCAGNANLQAVSRRHPGGAWAYLKPTCEYGLPSAIIIDTNVLPEQQWCYRVAASNNTTSAYSNEVCLTVDIYDPPVAPVLAATASASGITVDITDKAMREQGFRLYRRNTGSADWGMPIREFAAQSGTGLRITWVDSGVSADVRYDYSAVVYHQYGLTRSNVVAVDSWPSPAAAPSMLSLVPAGPYKLIVSWQDNSISEDGFRIVDSSPGYGSETHTVGAGVTTVTISTGANRDWTVSVRAFNERGESAAITGTIHTPATDPTPADLVPLEVVTNPPLPGPGETFEFGWSECNNGQTAASGYRTFVRRTTGGVPTEIANLTGLTLAPGTCIWRSLSQTLPANTYDFEVFVDFDGVVPESAEGNNSTILHKIIE
jgi:hypothetical protein